MFTLLDTNVLLAALVARGTSCDLLEHSVRQLAVISSQFLRNELREVLDRKFCQRPPFIPTFLFPTLQHSSDRPASDPEPSCSKQLRARRALHGALASEANARLAAEYSKTS